jgi:hypothetical protein
MIDCGSEQTDMVCSLVEIGFMIRFVYDDDQPFENLENSSRSGQSAIIFQ